jgi:hypothetical protein
LTADGIAVLLVFETIVTQLAVGVFSPQPLLAVTGLADRIERRGCTLAFGSVALFVPTLAAVVHKALLALAAVAIARR